MNWHRLFPDQCTEQCRTNHRHTWDVPCLRNDTPAQREDEIQRRAARLGRREVGGWDWVNGKGRGNGDPKSFTVATIADDGTKLTIDEALCARIVELEGIVTRVTKQRDELLEMDGEQDSELRVLRTQRATCERGHCGAAYRENGRGGEARRVVAATANELGLDLHEDKPAGVRDIWAPENMRRVTLHARVLKTQLAPDREVIVDNNRLRGELLTQERTSTALRDELKAATETLAQIEEALERPYSFEDAVLQIQEVLDA